MVEESGLSEESKHVLQEYGEMVSSVNAAAQEQVQKTKDTLHILDIITALKKEFDDVKNKKMIAETLNQELVVQIEKVKEEQLELQEYRDDPPMLPPSTPCQRKAELATSPTNSESKRKNLFKRATRTLSNSLFSTPKLRLTVRRSSSQPTAMYEIKNILNISSTSSQMVMNESISPTRPTFILRPACSERTPFEEALEKRQHDFQLRRVFNKIMCTVCSLNFGFSEQAVKCKACKQVSHQSCRHRAALPCIPYVRCPEPEGAIRLQLSEYCHPELKPILPALFVHAMRYLNNNLNAKGLFVTVKPSDPGVSSFLKMMKTRRDFKFLNEADPCLVSAAVLLFLLELREPLIPNTSFHDFSKAAKYPQPHQNYVDIIYELPHCHRNVLAYLFMFLSNYASRQSQTIIRSISDSVMYVIMPFSKCGNEPQIFNMLLGITKDFWMKLIEDDTKVWSQSGKIMNMADQLRERQKAQSFIGH